MGVFERDEECARDLMARRKAESSRKDEFPIGMRVLAVDDDVVCLRLLETQLMQCGYRVTVAQHAFTALKLLRESKNNYDIVISDVQMPDMDGFKLLEIIGLEMGLPVIMLSINGDTNYVMKGVLHGAVDYLVKPVRLEDLRLIWKHVIKKSLHDKKADNDHGHSNMEEKKADNSQYLSASSNCMDQTNEREDYANESSDGKLSKHKRPRVSWSKDLHTRFIGAVNQLGIERAVPKSILELMNVQGITRENVASHLQKYRKTLKKNGIGLNQQYHAGPPVHTLRMDSPSSVIFSFNQQGHAKDSNRRAMPSPFHQSTSFSRANVSTGYAGYSTNYFGLERAHPSPGFSSFIHQPLTSTSDQVNAYAEKIHQNQCPYSGSPDPISSCQLQCTSNQDCFGIFFENNNPGFNDSADLNSALLYADMTAQTGGDILDMQRHHVDKPNDTCHREFAKNQLEDSSFDKLFHLNRCHSADDLNTIIKQFQQSER